MAVYFPRESIAWRLEEPSALRRLSVAIVPYGLLAGVAMRGYRWVILVVVQPDAALSLIISMVVAFALLAAVTAGHLANFTLGSWRWRAPVFGLMVAAGESLTSLLLTAMRQERIGRSVATFADWLPTTYSLVWSRVLVVVVFAAVLAVVVSLVHRSLDAPRTR